MLAGARHAIRKPTSCASGQPTGGPSRRGRGRYVSQVFEKLGGKCVAIAEVNAANMDKAQTQHPEAKAYIEYRELQGMAELYDLEADPGEEKNLVGTPGAATLLRRMQDELRALRQDTALPR